MSKKKKKVSACSCPECGLDTDVLLDMAEGPRCKSCGEKLLRAELLRMEQKGLIKFSPDETGDPYGIVELNDERS